MSEPPGWFRVARRWADDRAPQPPAAASLDSGDADPDESVAAGQVAIAVDADDLHDGPSLPTTASTPTGVDPARPDVDTSAVDPSVGPPIGTPSDQQPGPKPIVLTRYGGRRRRLVIGVSLSVAALLVVVLGVEVVGRTVLQRRIADEIRATGVATRADVTIGRSWWTPSVSRLLLTGTLDMVDVELTSTDVVGVPAESLHWVLFDLGVSLSIRSPHVGVVSLGDGRVTVVIDPASFGEMIGVPVRIHDGQLFLGDSDRPAKVSIRSTDLVVEHPLLTALIGSDSVPFPVSDPYMLPCDPELDMHDDRMVLHCSGSDLPGVLRGTFGADSSDPSAVDGAEVEIYTPGPIESGD